VSDRGLVSLASSLLRPDVAGWVLSALVLVLALRTPRRAAAPDPRLRDGWCAPILVALLAGGTRLVIGRWFCGGWFVLDENLSGCIEPARFLLREPPWLASDYVSYLAYLAGYRAFGFAATVPRIVNTLAVAVAGGVFYAAMRRAIGSRFAWIASVWFIAAAPFLVHSLYATQIGLGLLPVAVLAWVLADASLGPWHGIIMGPLLVLALYVYPASFLACASLLAIHAVLHWDRWRWSARGAVAAGLIAGGVAAVARFARGGGAFSPAEVPAALGILVRDTLWRSPSFNALNLDAAYLDPALQGFVLIGIAAGWRSRDGSWRWAMTGAMAFVLTLVLASMGGTLSTGIRRAFPAFGLLGIPLARGVREAARRMPRRLAVVMPIAALSLVLWHTVRLVKSLSLGFPEPDFVVGARAALAAEDMTGRDVIVVGERADVYGGDAFRCALVLDKRLGPRLGKISVVARSELAGRRGLAPGRAVVLASFRLPSEELRSTFERDPVRTISRKPNDAGRSARVARLRVLYVFDQGATTP
jgi:hypothetical protein